jgi:hypothetical protein
MFRRLARPRIGAIAAICVLVCAAGAYAYWTQGGTGSGSAVTGTNEAVTVNQTSVVTGLYPGGPAQPISGDFTNGNDSPVRVTSVTVTFGSIEGSPAGCSSADYQINNATATVNAQIPSGDPVGAWSGPSIQMLNSGSNQNGCKNATINLSFSSN